MREEPAAERKIKANKLTKPVLLHVLQNSLLSCRAQRELSMKISRLQRCSLQRLLPYMELLESCPRKKQDRKCLAVEVLGGGCNAAGLCCVARECNVTGLG